MRNRAKLSYRGAKAARQRVDLLPTFSEFEAVTIEIPGYKTKHPLVMYKRNALECIQHLLRNPLFAEDFNPIPRRHYDINGQRIITDAMSGEWAWNTQVGNNFELSYIRIN